MPFVSPPQPPEPGEQVVVSKWLWDQRAAIHHRLFALRAMARASPARLREPFRRSGEVTTVSAVERRAERCYGGAALVHTSGNRDGRGLAQNFPRSSCHTDPHSELEPDGLDCHTEPPGEGVRRSAL